MRGVLVTGYRLPVLGSESGTMPVVDSLFRLQLVVETWVGFFGASSVERLPTEIAITGQVRSFKSLRLGDH